MLLGLVCPQAPVPETVPLAASCAKPSAGQFTTCTPGHTLAWFALRISKPTDPQGPACSVVAVGPGVTPA